MRLFQLLALVVAGEAIFALPFVIPRVFRPVLMDGLGIDNTTLGWAFSIYGIVALISYGLGGPLADRFSVRPLMATALLSTAAGGLWMAMQPSVASLYVLYGLWGATTILLFWAGLMRATREWGGPQTQGTAYGLLDGGRGLFAAVVSSLAVWLFAVVGDPAEPSWDALQAVILCSSALTASAAGLVWVALPPPTTRLVGIDLGHIASVARRPAVWLQAGIILCAYVGYKSTDVLSLYASEVLGSGDTASAAVGTIAFWIRPVAALAAGVLADRIGGWKTLAIAFAAMALGSIGLSAGALAPGWTAFLLTLSTTCAGVYALRGVYFSVFGRAGIPVAATGTAVGIVSIVGYTPDIFMGPVIGWVLDGSPGGAGHSQLFLGIAGVAMLGVILTLAFAWVTRHTAHMPGVTSKA